MRERFHEWSSLVKETMSMSNLHRAVNPQNAFPGFLSVVTAAGGAWATCSLEGWNPHSRELGFRRFNPATLFTYQLPFMHDVVCPLLPFSVP